ncbi:4-hydroxy-tetrahydrodipicolinate synthase [Desulforegula conservatrix]|uniref:4-hydroxy-tetrahydrodipicolinate synthase n=1 Tax=Desulforegula conservatrix TaxID=153026 RepID=UPI0004081469|nr:4-hydroxy-tetrahydrodipicolinate synthase [Desulforegula conservatrix]
MRAGCYTALATPFTSNGEAVDYEGLERLIDFQIKSGITGILAVGTTGESCTLTWDEHNKTVEITAKKTKNKCACIAGAGSNNTKESIEAAMHAMHAGVDSILLVDPYYNGPSSLEIRREYIEPVAKAFPSLTIIPYVIPGRTGAQMFPEDLAIAYRNCPNVKVVKEATGNLDNMRKTRKCCGDDFLIFSGDDGLTFEMMTDPQIKASGIISVASNIVPGPITRMTELLAEGTDTAKNEAEKIMNSVMPLFDIVTVVTKENTPFGEVTCRARNPLGLKTLMNILGMPSGPCRQPLGKMTKQGIDKLINIAKKVQTENPAVLKPVAEFFNTDISARLNDDSIIKALIYQEY